MTWNLITQVTQPSDATTLTANFTNVDFADVSCFVISFQGTDGIATQGSTIQIGTSSGVLTSDYDLQSIYVGDTSGGLPASPSYYGFVNGGAWYINNSWGDNSSFPMIYLWSNAVTDKPQCSMMSGNETTWTGMSGWIDQTLTALGEVVITGVSSNNILADSRLQVYKVTK